MPVTLVRTSKASLSCVKIREADVGLFKAVTSNPDHVMYQLLPPLKNTPYHLRPRAHNFELPDVNNNLKKNCIHRML